MKFVIDLGHGCDFDGGAKGYEREENFINQSGLILINKLRGMGHICLESRPKSAISTNHSLKQRIDFANATDAELFVSIHYNAFFQESANGCEVLAVSDIGRKYAQSVVNEIAKLGFKNRGVKSGKRIAVIERTKMPAILTEGCFVTNKDDCERFNAETMADAIIKGILCT